jgi:hypothetical protein
MRRLSKALGGVVILWVVFPATSGAVDAGQAPLVAQQYLEAVRAEGFSAEARFMHPEELARFQQLVVPAFEAEQAEGSRVLLNATFGRDAAVLDARLADPEDFMRRFARVMAVRMPDQHVGFDELQVVGSVEEGEKMHVLVRLRTLSEKNPLDELTVVTLLPDGEEWKLTLSPELEAAARSMDRSSQSRLTRPQLAPRHFDLTSEPQGAPSETVNSSR